MQWEVSGADAHTGEDRTITIEAASAQQAEQVAGLQGMLVASVTKLDTGPKPVSAYQSRVADPTSVAVTVPEYLGLRVAGTVLWILCIPAYAGGGILLLLSAVSMGQTLLNVGQSSFIYLSSSLLSLFAAGGPLVIAAVLHALSSLCFAIRDIARNSFIQVSLAQENCRLEK